MGRNQDILERRLIFMNKIIINDLVKLSDNFNRNIQDNFRPVGIITVYDKNGNILAQTHNMIVEEGRRMLMSLLFQYGSNIIKNMTSGDDISNFLVSSEEEYRSQQCFSDPFPTCTVACPDQTGSCQCSLF